MTDRNDFWVLSRAPLGAKPALENFSAESGPIPAPAAGQMLTRTIFISLDPYQWWYKLRGAEKPGDVCHARTVSQVLESRLPGFAAGDYVFNTNGWARFGLTGDGIPRPGYMIPRRLDPALGPISYAVGPLGMLGLTAYAGMLVQCGPKPGETVVVSAAAGGVGQLAGQLARIRGARVVGIAGPAEKCDYVTKELGFAACVSYRSPTYAADLAAACPDGVDCYFENVGGAVFDGVLPLLNAGGRFTLCGMIASLGDPDPDPKGTMLGKVRRALEPRNGRVFELFVGDFVPTHEAICLAEMADWLRAGEIRYREDIRDGFEGAPQHFIDMMSGANFGKSLVRLSVAD